SLDFSASFATFAGLRKSALTPAAARARGRDGGARSRIHPIMGCTLAAAVPARSLSSCERRDTVSRGGAGAAVAGGDAGALGAALAAGADWTSSTGAIAPSSGMPPPPSACIIARTRVERCNKLQQRVALLAKSPCQDVNDLTSRSDHQV